MTSRAVSGGMTRKPNVTRGPAFITPREIVKADQEVEQGVPELGPLAEHDRHLAIERHQEQLLAEREQENVTIARTTVSSPRLELVVAMMSPFRQVHHLRLAERVHRHEEHGGGGGEGEDRPDAGLDHHPAPPAAERGERDEADHGDGERRPRGRAGARPRRRAGGARSARVEEGRGDARGRQLRERDAEEDHAPQQEMDSDERHTRPRSTLPTRASRSRKSARRISASAHRWIGMPPRTAARRSGASSGRRNRA